MSQFDLNELSFTLGIIQIYEETDNVGFTAKFNDRLYAGIVPYISLISYRPTSTSVIKIGHLECFLS